MMCSDAPKFTQIRPMVPVFCGICGSTRTILNMNSFSFYFNRGVISLIIFFRKKRSKKSVVVLKSLRLQGCSPRQDTLACDLMKRLKNNCLISVDKYSVMQGPVIKHEKVRSSLRLVLLFACLSMKVYGLQG